MEDMYIENCKTWQREIIQDLYKWRDMPYQYFGKLNIVEMSILIKLSYRLNAIPFRILIYFSEEIYTMILKFIWKCKI